jgi:hypothetical protein
MSTYSEVSEDYKMFETKADANYHDSITNHVSVNDMMQYMFAILVEYDRCLSNKVDAKINPMSGRVMMSVGNGLKFEIPEDIQKLAIVKYLEMKNKKKDITGCLRNQVQDTVQNSNNNIEAETKERHALDLEHGTKLMSASNAKILEKFISTKDLQKMIPSIPKKIDTRTVMMVVLVLIALFSIYKFCEEKRLF